VILDVFSRRVVGWSIGVPVIENSRLTRADEDAIARLTRAEARPPGQLAGLV
jgi:transposase InsO family protein